MVRLSRLILWALIIALLISTSNAGLRHVLLPNDARATDAEICAVILLVLIWIGDFVDEIKEEINKLKKG